MIICTIKLLDCKFHYLFLFLLLVLTFITRSQNTYSQSIENLNWSSQPGAFEQQLKRQYNNPLFPKELRIVTSDDLAKAKKRDMSDYEKAKFKVNSIMERILKLPDEMTSSEINKIREEIDNLIEECIGISGEANFLVDQLTKLRHQTISTWRKALKSYPEALEILNKAEKINPVNRPEFSTPFVLQMMREDGPISSAEVLPSLLSEDPETIRLVMGLMDSEKLTTIQSTALSIIQSAIKEGAKIENLEEKLKALGIKK